MTLDASGNLTEDGIYSYIWSDAGLLQSVSKAAPLLATYYYDYRNRRTRKVTTASAPQGAQTVMYHYDQADRLIGETLGNGTALRTYVWLEEQLTAVIEHAAVSTPQRTLYLQLDHLGTPRVAKDATGTVQWRWDSDGYGSTAANEDPDGDGRKTTLNLRFPGQYYDQESGLHYNWNRYYSPRLGRYISSDPIGTDGGANTYGYVEGNPLSKTDPMGLSSDNPFGGSQGSGGFTRAPTPFDVFVPGTSANNAFVRSVNQVANALKELCKDGAEECKQECGDTLERDEAECLVARAGYGRAAQAICLAKAKNYYASCLRKCDGK